MKKILIAVMVLAAATGKAQTKNLGDFNALKVFDRINVELIQSSENKIELSGKRSGDVEVVNKNGQLKIRMSIGKLLDGEDVRARLYFTELNDIDASEGALISSAATFQQPAMTITAKEGAQIELNLDVAKADVKSVTGGIVRLNGKATTMDARLGTGGVLEAKTLVTQQTDVSINAGGEAEIHATELVDANVKAGGDITIYGHPKTINKKTALGGRIEESKK